MFKIKFTEMHIMEEDDDRLAVFRKKKNKIGSMMISQWDFCQREKL